MKIYTDVGERFVVTVPDTWEPGQTPPTRLAIVLTGPSALPNRRAPAIFRAQVNRQQNGQAQRTIDEHCRGLVRQVTKNPADETLIEPATIDGADARQFAITLEDARGMKIDMMYVVVVRPPNTYVFTYLQERGLFDPDEAAAIFSSIRWIR